MHFYTFRLRNIIALFLIILFLIITFPVKYSLSSSDSSSSSDIKEDEIKVPIIMYHSLLKDKAKGGKYVISPATLESDMSYIAENGYTTILVSDLINYVYDDISIPDKPIILTFDDGYYNNYSYLFPLLKKFNMKAVISVVGSYTDNYSSTDIANANYGYLRWKDISELQNSGLIEFANHTYDLHKCKNGRSGCKKMYHESFESYNTILSTDLLKLQKEFSDNINFTPYLFTYPYGGISKDSISIIKSLGFKSSLSCTFGINSITKNPDCLFNLKRNNRPSGISTAKFFKKYIEK